VLWFVIAAVAVQQRLYSSNPLVSSDLLQQQKNLFSQIHHNLNVKLLFCTATGDKHIVIHLVLPASHNHIGDRNVRAPRYNKPIVKYGCGGLDGVFIVVVGSTEVGPTKQRRMRVLFAAILSGCLGFFLFNISPEVCAISLHDAYFLQFALCCSGRHAQHSGELMSWVIIVISDQAVHPISTGLFTNMYCWPLAPWCI